MVRIASFEGIRSNRHSNFERYLAVDALPRKKHIDAMPARGFHASLSRRRRSLPSHFRFDSKTKRRRVMPAVCTL
jgi:hypothetical protein